ncbi:MAG: type II toxin-antitoxin system VapC family toxin, partial [Verrucomicrobia bacterium]|nr:type II toxin-antitoxin system VapC family toxin [Verrucomicrobiota bacterium]
RRRPGPRQTGRGLTPSRIAVSFLCAMKKFSLYLETSVVSYLTARPASDLNTAAHQQITSEWWETKRKHFDIFISKLVIKEAAAGDAEAARRRLKMLKRLRLLPLSREAVALARDFGRVGCMPATAADDALHVALAAVHGVHFLLTWNCTHINNVATIEEIRNVCENHDYSCPVICTPDELIRI